MRKTVGDYRTIDIDTTNRGTSTVVQDRLEGQLSLVCSLYPTWSDLIQYVLLRKPDHWTIFDNPTNSKTNRLTIYRFKLKDDLDGTYVIHDKIMLYTDKAKITYRVYKGEDIVPRTVKGQLDKYVRNKRRMLIDSQSESHIYYDMKPECNRDIPLYPYRAVLKTLQEHVAVFLNRYEKDPNLVNALVFFYLTIGLLRDVKNGEGWRETLKTLVNDDLALAPQEIVDRSLIALKETATMLRELNEI